MSEGNNLELLIDSTTDISHNSHFFAKDFKVKSDAIYIAGTTDYADSLSQGQRTYDFFVSKFNKDGTVFSNFADNGVFQKDLEILIKLQH